LTDRKAPYNVQENHFDHLLMRFVFTGKTGCHEKKRDLANRKDVNTP
jgi:hypothetical protein